MITIRYHSIEASSYVDGPGERTVIFFQGCTLHCPGCQNQKLWPAEGGHIEDVGELARSLGMLARHGNLTISGGEALQQPVALAVLVALLKQAHRVKHIILYTGYTIEELCQPYHPARPFLPQILQNIDVMVDGRFIAQLDDPYIAYRGSRNQRVIDIPATLRAGAVVELDWSLPEVVVTPMGNVFTPVGLVKELADIGSILPTRRCGER